MLTVLVPAPLEEAELDEQLPQDTKLTYQVLVPTSPQLNSPVAMQVSRAGVSDVLDLAYHAMGHAAVDQVIDSLKRSKSAATDDARERALAFAEVMREPFLRTRRETLKLVDDTAFDVFLDQLESARINCGIARCGFVGDNLVHPIVPADEERQALYKQFRTQVGELTLATRDYESALKRATLQGTLQVAKGVPAWARVFNPNSPPTGPVEMQRMKFLRVWSAAVGKFPVLSVAGSDFVAAAVAAAQDGNMATDAEFGDQFNPDRLRELCKPDAELKNALYEKLAGLCGQWARDVQKAGNELRKEFRQKAEAAAWGAANVDKGTYPPEPVFGEFSPLWRYPLIIREAMQRIDAIPGSLAYAAASHTLEIAADVAAKERESAELRHEILALASMSFGVMSLLPVVGQASGLAASACALANAVPAILQYREDKQLYAAFGPYASQHHLAAPDGVGLVLNSLDAATAAMPLVGVAGRMAGRMIRLSALQARTVGSVYAAADVALNAVALTAALKLNESQRP
jgi:hypothetical protein